ncbi:secretion related GTPase SrgD [Pseudohyphozyma bogoriensis]|nr:secretion related GTPase SrgD [Pseudohyphozyma bogoriensis]
MATWDFTSEELTCGNREAIGVEFGSRLVEVDSDGDDGGPKKKVKLQIWDTAGQESFRSITRSYYRGAGGALLVFSLGARSSFLSCTSWLEDLRAWGEEGLVILLVGNKGDLPGREVEKEEVEEWVREKGISGYVEVSAKTGDGVEEAFNQLTRTVHKKQQELLGSQKKKNTAGSGFPLVLGGSGKPGKCC